MTNNNILNQKSRIEIYNLVLKYPGLHLRKIIKELFLSEGTVRYHLDYLEKRELISTEYENGYRRYYVKNQIRDQDKEIMTILRSKTPRYIILVLLFDKVTSRAKLSKDLDVSPKVIEYHLKKLLKAGLIKTTTVKNGAVAVNHSGVRSVDYQNVTNEVVYILCNYPLINDFFIVNKDWFFDKITSNLINFSINLEKKKHPKKLTLFDKRLDNVLDTFYRVFPPPFYI